uniref:Uncharacterized protein n=1 Tax=Triticum urartu TaxID=4572 RepID=A0A8R7U8M6_TRIUA
MLMYKEEKDKDKFCLCFMQVILCAYLAPTTGYQINRSYLLGALKDLSDIPRMNWCRFAAEYLIEAIRESRENKVPNLNVGGCVHILHLIYVDLLQSHLVKIPQGYPRIKYVGSAVLEQIDHTGKKKTQDHCKLFESLLDDEKLAMFPTAEDHNDDLDDHEKSTHSTPPVTVNIITVPGQEKHILPPQVVQVSKKRLSHQATDEILEDQYTADRQRLITVSERKLQNKLQQLQIKKTKEMAALVQEEIQKAMLPMIDDARPGSSLHNDDATLTKRTVRTQSPCQSNLDEAVLNSSQSAELVHETSTHVDVIQQLTAGTPASPTFMNETVEIGTHESEPGTNFVNIEGVEADNFHPASPMLAQSTQYEPSSSKDLTTTDQIVQPEPAACKDPLVESICTFQNLKSDATSCSATTALERQETSVANVVSSSNNSASTHPPEFVSAVIVPTTAIVIPNIAEDQVRSHSVQTQRSNMPSEHSSIMKFVGTDGQADSAFLLPVTSAHNVLGHGNQGDQPESNAFAVQHPQQDSSKDVLHEVGNTVTTAPTVDGIQDIAFIHPKTTKSSSQIDVSDAQKATKNHSFSHNPT